MQKKTIPANWPNRLYPLAAVWALIAGGISFYNWGLPSFFATIVAALCLSAGLRITELLVAVFTKVREANSSAVGLLFLGKIAWWALLFWLSKHVSKALLPAVAMGLASFLLAMVSLALWLFGIPKISPVRSTGES